MEAKHRIYTIILLRRFRNIFRRRGRRGSPKQKPKNADPTTQEIRYLDKLIDELAHNKPMDKILRVQ